MYSKNIGLAIKNSHITLRGIREYFDYITQLSHLQQLTQLIVSKIVDMTRQATYSANIYRLAQSTSNNDQTSNILS